MNFLSLIIIAVAAYCFGLWRGWRRGWRAASERRLWIMLVEEQAERIEREFENRN